MGAGIREGGWYDADPEAAGRGDRRIGNSVKFRDDCATIELRAVVAEWRHRVP